MDEQRQLLDQLTGALRADERVLAIWIIGSLASGVGDASSDVDLLLAIEEGAFGALIRDWQVWMGRLIPTVYARRLGAAERPTITAITPEWRCFDLTLASATDASSFSYAAVLQYARPGYHPAWRFAAPGRHGGDPTRLADLVTEFIRVLGLLPAVIDRGEYLVSLTGVFLQRNALIELALIENGAERTGVKRLNAFLTGEQRSTLEGLPPLVATRAAVIEAHVACARAFLPRARAAMATRNQPFPEGFAQATLEHLERRLGIAL